jgi:tellurite methyltransferase
MCYMDVRHWDARYRSRERAKEDFGSPAAALVVETASQVSPGRALDLACGTGRNAVWLAEQSWSVSAVDGSAVAIEVVRQRAADRMVTIDAIVADLEAHEYPIRPTHWDLIVISYYLQRDLFEPAMAGVAPGGLLLAIVHITEHDEEPTKTRLGPGELAEYFSGWEILHSYEGKPTDDANHQRSVAEIVARRPWHQPSRSEPD